MSEIAALAMSETSGQVDNIPGITCRTFRYGIVYINFEHMATTLTTYNIVSEMNTTTFDCQYFPLNEEVSYFLSCFFDKPGKCGSGYFHFVRCCSM